MSKLKAGEVAVWATERAIQILGGNGYTREFPVERMHRDAKIYDDLRGHLGDPAPGHLPRDLGPQDPVAAQPRSAQHHRQARRAGLNVGSLSTSSS